MTAFSITFDFLDLKDLKETRDDIAKQPAQPVTLCNCGCDFMAAFVAMLDGKIALREMKCLKQRRPKIIRVPNPPTSKKRRTPKRP